MSKKISLALLASASCLGLSFGFSDPAAAIDAAPLTEPTVIYAREPAPPQPVRTAYAERSQMGGGFIEFLFGDAPQGGRYQQQPMYQQQPDYGAPREMLPPMDPRQSLRQQEEGGDPAQRPLNPIYEKRSEERRVGKECRQAR